MKRRLRLTTIVLLAAGAGVFVCSFVDLGVSVPSPQVMAKADMTIAPVENSAEPQAERRVASHDPESALRAYRAISSCVQQDQARRLLPGIPIRAVQEDVRSALRRGLDAAQASCEAVTEVEKRGIFDLLNQALQARVPGAAVAFFSAGPFGDPLALEMRADDPMVVQWKAQALSHLMEAARLGDVEAIASLSLSYQEGILTPRDNVLAFQYEVARLEAVKARSGEAGSERLLMSLGAGISDEQKALATRSGKQFAQR